MNKKTKNIVLTGLMAAIIAALSVWQIQLPFGVPLTFQTFAVSLSGYVLGHKRGTLAAFLYIFIGAVGLPVFSGFMGGISVLAGPGGGFITGFLPLAFFAGCAADKKLPFAILLGISGLIVCHTVGIIHFAIVMKTSAAEALIAVSLPYFVKDCFLVALSCFLSHPIRRGLK